MDHHVDARICFTCGFLCRRDVVNSHLADYREITQEDREKGRWIRRDAREMAPWCFRTVPILEEIRDITGVVVPVNEPPEQFAAQSTSLREAAEVVIRRERDCPKWMRYEPGLSPEAHRGEQFNLEHEKRRDEFERHMESERRTFLNLNDEFQKSAFRVTLLLAIAALVLAVGQIIAAVAALACESLVWSWVGSMWTGFKAPGC